MIPNMDNAVNYHYGKFPPSKIEYNKFVNELIAASSALARYDQMLKNLHNSEILLAPLRNQEAVISSRMEGTISTMDEILQYEADSSEGGDTKNNLYRSDVFETILYQRALKSAQGAMEDGYEISASFIKTLHQRLLSWGKGAAKAPGKFKHEQNYLADKVKRDIRFIPISPESLDSGLDVLLNYMKESVEPILVKTGLMHLEFEALHPFQDGNGRIGRMLITLYLWHAKQISAPHFYISGFFEENKDEYIDTMRNVSQNNEWERWLIFFLTAIEKQATKNLEIAEDISSLYEKMKNVFSELLSSRYGITALDFIFTNPIFRNSKFTSHAGIPPATAQRFAKVLLENGLITTKQEASGRRSALYSFEPLMQLVRV